MQNILPPAYIIDALPALSEAWAVVETEKAAAEVTTREQRAAGAALMAISNRVNGGGWVARPGVSAADFDAAQLALAAATAAARVADRRLELAWRALDEAVTASKRGGELRRVAAARALELTDRAAPLWVELSAVLDERDATLAAGGTIGRSWTTTRGANILEADGGAGAASRVITARIDGFDRVAAEAVAAGETPASARPRPVDGYRAGFDALAPTDEHGRSAR